MRHTHPAPSPLQVMYPNDTLRRRMQMQGADGRPPRPLRQVVADLVRVEGAGALYRGVGATLIRAIPSTGIQFGAYELAKEAIRMGRAWT